MAKWPHTLREEGESRGAKEGYKCRLMKKNEVTSINLINL